ncbi:hypothetical protein SDC9_191299 [bioreactor metagenome]|uniref:Uncharacterized protein n=1 Tax=bioreactor metagenome TaxID=1076179 RepID=A0A645HZX1_9ZZZZ
MDQNVILCILYRLHVRLLFQFSQNGGGEVAAIDSHLRSTGLAAQFFRFTSLQQLTLTNDRHQLAHFFGLAEIMRGQEDGHTLIPGQPFQIIAQGSRSYRVKTCSGFIQKDQFGFMKHGPGNRQFLLHTAAPTAHNFISAIP